MFMERRQLRRLQLERDDRWDKLGSEILAQAAEEMVIDERITCVSKLVLYGPEALVREKVALLESEEHRGCCIQEESCGEHLTAYLAGIQWLTEEEACQMLTQLKWAAYVLNFEDNALQTIASKAASEAVDFRQTLCTLIEDPVKWQAFTSTDGWEVYPPDILQEEANPLLEGFLGVCKAPDGKLVTEETTSFPNRIWRHKSRYEEQNDENPPRMPDWWGIDETGNLNLHLLDRMTLPNRSIGITCENAVLSDLLNRHHFPSNFDFPTSYRYERITLKQEGCHIQIVASPSKRDDLDYDNSFYGDFYALFSLDAVMAAILDFLKDILKVEKQWSGTETAVKEATSAFEADFLQHAREMLGAFTMADCGTTYITQTNIYWEPISGLSINGELKQRENGMQYVSWIEKY